MLLDEYISVFLPSLKGEVTYFDGFDLAIINVRYAGEQGWENGPVIEAYYLKAVTPVSPQIRTYLNGIDSPIEWKAIGS